MNTLTLKLEILSLASMFQPKENPLKLCEELYEWVMLEAKQQEVKKESADIYPIN